MEIRPKLETKPRKQQGENVPLSVQRKLVCLRPAVKRDLSEREREKEKRERGETERETEREEKEMKIESRERGRQR